MFLCFFYLQINALNIYVFRLMNVSLNPSSINLYVLIGI